MENWIEKMKRGDINKAARLANLDTANYRNARAKGFKDMSPAEITILHALKEVIEKREKMLAEITRN